jgi:hypothetical protein
VLSDQKMPHDGPEPNIACVYEGPEAQTAPEGAPKWVRVNGTERRAHSLPEVWMVTCGHHGFDSLEARTRTAAIRVGALSSCTLCYADAGLWHISSRQYDADCPVALHQGPKRSNDGVQRRA